MTFPFDTSARIMASSTSGHAATAPLLVAGRYEVMLSDVLGTGGLATVYRARDAATGKVIAAKRLHDAHRDRPESLRRFRRESRMTSYAHPHPNIVGFVDYIEDPPWIMLELVEGDNLKHYLEQEGPPGLETVVTIVTQIAVALDHLHARGVVHLDIKPQNLIVTRENGIKLIDFGLAQEFAAEQDRVGDHLYGTAAYMAPEQPAHRPVNERTDVYAFGCVFYELVTGRPPFEAQNLTGEAEQLALLEAHRTAEAIPPSEARPDLALPSWVDDVVDRALAKDPDHRYASAGALVTAARRGMGMPVPLRPQSTGKLKSASRFPRQFHVGDTETPVEADIASLTEPRGPGVMRRSLAAGRRRLRESPRVRRLVMRAVMLMAVIMTIVAINMAATSGLMADMLVDVVPAITTEVSVSLNLRSGPSMGAEVLTVLPVGSEATITGGPERSDGHTWWPVTVTTGGSTATGWVSGDGIENSAWMRAVTYPKIAGDVVRDAIETVTGWIP